MSHISIHIRWKNTLAVFACLFPVILSACGGQDTATGATGATPILTGELQVSIDRTFPRLDFDQPVLLAFEPAGSRVVVLEQAGKIKIFQNDDAAGQASVLLDISDKVKSGGEEGLLGFAFDPDFPANKNFFVYYSAANPRR